MLLRTLRAVKNGLDRSREPKTRLTRGRLIGISEGRLTVVLGILVLLALGPIVFAPATTGGLAPASAVGQDEAGRDKNTNRSVGEINAHKQVPEEPASSGKAANEAPAGNEAAAKGAAGKATTDKNAADKNATDKNATDKNGGEKGAADNGKAGRPADMKNAAENANPGEAIETDEVPNEKVEKGAVGEKGKAGAAKAGRAAEKGKAEKGKAEKGKADRDSLDRTTDEKEGDDKNVADKNAGEKGVGADIAGAKESFLTWLYRSLGTRYVIIFLIITFNAVALIVMIVLGLRRNVICPDELIADFEAKLDAKQYQEAYELAKKSRSFLGKVLAAGMSRLSDGYDASMQAMQEVGEEQNMRLEQRNGYIALIAQIGPMFGLLGTVDGMVMAFDVIAHSNVTPKPSELAQGIGTALVTTVVGLWIAIPSIAFYHIIRNRLTRLVVEAGGVSSNLMKRFAVVQVPTKKS